MPFGVILTCEKEGLLFSKDDYFLTLEGFSTILVGTYSFADFSANLV
jgi:hypothetical protein